MKIRYLPALLACAVVLSAHADDKVQLSTDKQKFSYAVGLQVGQSLLRQGIDLDVNAFTLAVQDAVNGHQPRLTMEELRTVLQHEQQRMEAKQAALAKKNAEAGKKFLAENKKKKGVVQTASGLQYEILKKGTGPKPTKDSTVTVNYKGMLIDGREFDSSARHGEPATLEVSKVIKGWQEALPMMSQGAKWRIFVPPQLAYGDRGAGQVIGPDETLVFDIELLKVQ